MTSVAVNPSEGRCGLYTAPAMDHVPLMCFKRVKHVKQTLFCPGKKHVLMTNNKTFNTFMYRKNNYSTETNQKMIQYKQKKKELSVLF